MNNTFEFDLKKTTTYFSLQYKDTFLQNYVRPIWLYNKFLKIKREKPPKDGEINTE